MRKKEERVCQWYILSGICMLATKALLLQQVEGLLGGEGIGGLLGIFGNLQLGGGSNVAVALGTGI